MKRLYRLIVFVSQNGPMAEGIPPQEASERLAIFQGRFDELWRRFQTYSGGEELFGLPITDYPFLHKVKYMMLFQSQILTL